MMSPWAYPENRYYYEWYADEQTHERSDGEIKQHLLDQIRTGPYEDQYDIEVDVKKGVVILTGTAKTTVAKRAAGDDAWDTRGVTDVSNQIQVKSAIPVGIWGTHRRWSRSGRHWGRPWRPRLGLAFGEPIEPTGDVSQPEDIDSFLERVREGLERQLSAARILAGDPQPG